MAGPGGGPPRRRYADIYTPMFRLTYFGLLADMVSQSHEVSERL